MLFISATYPPNALGKLSFVLLEHVGDSYTQNSFCFLFLSTHFLLKKKVGKENFVRTLKQSFFCWHSQPLTHPISLDSSALFHWNMSVMATLKVLFASFFSKKKEVFLPTFSLKKVSKKNQSKCFTLTLIWCARRESNPHALASTGT